MKIRNAGPKSETANECTEDMTPLLVKKVPNITSMNVDKIRMMFHNLRSPFFS